MRYLQDILDFTYDCKKIKWILPMKLNKFNKTGVAAFQGFY